MDKNKIQTNVRDPFTSIRTVTRDDKEHAQKRADIDFKNALIEVLSTESGRTVFKRLFDESGFFASAFDTNALVMAKREGKREFAQLVFDHVMRADSDLLKGILNE